MKKNAFNFNFLHFKKSNIKEIVWYQRKFSYKFIMLKKKRNPNFQIYTSFLISNSIVPR